MEWFTHINEKKCFIIDKKRSQRRQLRMSDNNMNSVENFYKEQYTIMHDMGHFPGFQSIFLRNYLKKIFEYFNVKTVLDYGCGKGYQYFLEGIHHHWNLEKLRLYDIGVNEFSIKPSKNERYDCVLCLDVLEHIRESDLEYFLYDVISYAEKIIVASISTRPAKKNLPNGENAHLTIKSEDWWNNFIIGIYEKYRFPVGFISLYELESSKDIKKTKQYFINFSKKDLEQLEKITFNFSE